MNVLPFRTARDVSRAIPAVATHLSAGGLLAYPTETVYGLGSRPEPEDIAALVTLKGRPRGKPFLLLIANLRMADAYDLVLPPSAMALADAFWPGPLTLVLPGGEGKLSDTLRGPEGGIAVRWTSKQEVADLIEALGYPITSTSANRPGSPPAPGASRIGELFEGAVADGTLLVLDGGALGHVPSSTLVDCTGVVPKMIREGAIPRGELQARVGSLAP